MTEVSKQGTTENSVAQNSRSATISIHDIFKNVNSRDKDFVKYIPSQFRNEDVQYSERGNGISAYDIMGEHNALEKRYNKLKTDFDNLKELLKIEKSLTNGKIMQKSQLEAAARFLVKYGDSNYNVFELAKMLNDLYVDLQDGAMDDSMTWDEMYAKAYESLQFELQQSQSFKKELKTQKITVKNQKNAFLLLQFLQNCVIITEVII